MTSREEQEDAILFYLDELLANADWGDRCVQLIVLQGSNLLRTFYIYDIPAMKQRLWEIAEQEAAYRWHKPNINTKRLVTTIVDEYDDDFKSSNIPQKA